MPSLAIPESGVSLEGLRESFSKPGPGVPDVVGLTLTDGVIEEMIKCFQIGKPIQLSFGEYPVRCKFSLRWLGPHSLRYCSAVALVDDAGHCRQHPEER
jgi:hypothetical protein